MHASGSSSSPAPAPAGGPSMPVREPEKTGDHRPLLSSSHDTKVSDTFDVKST
jgi:hypothetical protein